jgi:RNA polymerase sigma factor (sigma-70 family)
MPSHTLTPLLRRLRQPGAGGPAASSDAELLAAFAGRRDEDAFAELVRRHGPVVRGVGRRVLGEAHAADDVFQAAFLTLARQAAALRGRPALGPWLYTVAYRLACSARAAERRRRRREEQVRPAASPDPSIEVAWRELRRTLDEELARLPERLRVPLVLCYLQGRPRDAAAGQLGWSLGTLKRRLERGRALLRARLRDRGVSLGLAGWAVLGSDAEVPAALVRSTARAAGQVPALPPSAGVLGVKSVVGIALGLGLLAGLASRPVTSPAADPPATRAAGPHPAPSKSTMPRTDLFGDPLPEHALARLGTVRLRTGGPITGLMFLPGDNELISASFDGSVRLWDLVTGKEARRLAGGLDLIGIAVLSPDGTAVAAISNDSTVHVWDVTTGREVRTFGNLPSYPPALAFAPGGQALAAGYAGERLIRLWDLATGRELRQFKGEITGVECVAFTPDGRTLIAGDDAGSVFVWDVASGKLRRSWKTPARWVLRLAVSPDGQSLATVGGGSESEVRLWEIDTGREVRQLATGDRRVDRVTFAPDGRTLAVGGQVATEFGSVQLWDPATGQQLRRWTATGFGMGALTFSHDGRTVAAAGNDCRIRLWEAATGKELQPAAGDASRTLTAAFSPDGRLVATGGMDGAVRLWEATTGRLLHRCGSHGGWVNRVAFTPDGRRLLSAGMDSTLRAWDTATGQELRRITGFASDTFTAGIAVGADGRTATARGADNTVRSWDLDTGREVRRLSVAGRSLQLALSPDGQTLATAASGEREETTIRLWDWPAGTERKSWAAPNRHASALAFSRDGTVLALAGRGGEPPKVFNAATGREWPLTGLPTGGSVEAAAFSLDGRRLALAGTRVPVGVWELATGQPCRRWETGQFAVFALDFSPDGRTLVSANGDGTALVWDLSDHVPPRDLSAEDLDQLGRDLAGLDAGRAWRAVQELSAAPTASVPWLRERLRPVEPPEPKALAGLLADLAGDRFADRERATQALERLGELAGPALQQVLADNPPLEVRRRVRRLLDRLDGPVGDPVALLGIRGVEVLERIRTADSRALLGRLAGGATGARVSREARAALARMER